MRLLFLNSETKIHAAMLVLASLALLNMLVLPHLANAGLITLPVILLTIIQVTLGGGLHAIHIGFVSLHLSRKVTWIYGGILIFMFLLAGSYMNMPLNEVRSSPMDSFILSGALFIQICQVWYLFILIIMRSFSADKMNNRFLVAANVFVFIPMIFSLGFWMLSVSTSVNLLGGDGSQTITELFALSTQYSCYALGGIDIPDNVHTLIRNIASIESIFAQLYLVILVGRMMTK